jgi:hypothetical protein
LAEDTDTAETLVDNRAFHIYKELPERGFLRASVINLAMVKPLLLFSSNRAVAMTRKFIRIEMREYRNPGVNPEQKGIYRHFWP